MDPDRKWVEVTVEDPRTGIFGLHYMEVDPSLAHPEAWAKHQEAEKGFRVICARIWNQEGR